MKFAPRADLLTLCDEYRNMSFMDMQANITDSIHSNQYIVRKVKFSGLDLAAKDSSLAHGRSSDPYLLLLQGADLLFVFSCSTRRAFVSLTASFCVHARVHTCKHTHQEGSKSDGVQ